MSNASENFLLFSDMFYGKIHDLKQFYKKFYAREQALEDALSKFRQNTQDQEADEWIGLMIELFLKYNQALDSLKDFENEIGLDHSTKIIQTVRKYLSPLGDLGVQLKPNGHLNAQAETLRIRLKEEPSRANFLFHYQHGLLFELNQLFKKIQAKPNQSIFVEKMEQTLHHYASGQIVDKKS